jgi:hypothetical protein
LAFSHSAIAKLRQFLATHEGVSRQYAIPLLEFLDREYVTRREGDERLVR